MDASLPAAVPVPCKSRRGWLIAFGVIEILLGCGFLLMIALSAFVFLGPAVSKMPANSMPAGPFSRLAIMAMVGLQYGALAVVFFAGGIGSIRCKNWARILMLVVSGLWIAFGLIATLGMAFMFPMIMRQQPSKISCEQQHAMIVGMITFMAVLGVLVPAVFLFFYTRKGVKATCLALKGTEVMARGTAQEFSPPGLPIPLGIMGAWEALSALAVLATLFVRVTFMFGVVLHGATAVLVLLTYSILSGVAAWFIFRQKVIGWKITFFKVVFWTISMIVTFLRHPDMMQIFREIGYDARALHVYEQFPQLLPGIWLGSILMMTVFLVFLLYTRKFFPPEEQK